MLKFICYNILPTICDHAMDFTQEHYKSAWGLNRLHNLPELNPYSIKSGDCVFVKTDFIVSGEFQNNILNKICFDFKLVTGNSSYKIGRDGGDSYKKILNDPRVTKWFCVNPPDVDNDKIVPISIGFEEPDREGGNQELLNDFNIKKCFEKKENIFLPFHTVSTNSERQAEIQKLSKENFINFSSNKQSFSNYMQSLAEHKFAIGLEGSGPDIHRAYESLLVHTVPIMKKGSLKKVFDFHNLPGIFVDSWNEVSEEFFDKIKNITYNFDSSDLYLSIEYYKKLIRSA